MEQGLKERLVGAAVLVILAVIFIPMLLDDTGDGDILITDTNIPSKPENMPASPAAGRLPAADQISRSAEPAPADADFSSRIIPLEGATGTVQAAREEDTENAAAPAVEKIPAVETPVPEPSSPETSTPASPKPAAEPVTTITKDNGAAATGVGLSAWVVQLGSFSSDVNAEVLNQKLRKAGFRSFVEPLKQGNTVAYRVRVGPELKRSDAEAINAKLDETLQLKGIVVHYP